MNSFDRHCWRHWVGAGFLAAQLLAIAYARFVPERFFCWAPFDQHTQYTIHVQIDGEALPYDTVSERYRYRAGGWEVRAIQNVISLVRQYEETYGRSEEARVVIDYEINGRPQETWTWPESGDVLRP